MRKIRWGVLGTAHIAQGCTIPGMLRAENCALYAIAGRSMEKAELFRKEFGFERAYDSYDALLADPQVEAVYIPLPNSLHREWVIRAVKAGKHVLCEKPMAASAAEAEEMFRAAKENGVILMEAFAYLHSPLIEAIRAELDAGAIGEVRYLENAFVTAVPREGNIRLRRETLGGSLYDLGCYCTSQAVWLLGEPCDARASAEFTEAGIDRVTTGTLHWPDGKCAAFTCGMVLSRAEGGRIDRLQIQGTEGILRTDAAFNQAGDLTYEILRGDERVARTVHAPHNYALEVAQLGRCIAEGEAPRVSEAFTLANARTMDRLLSAIGY